MIPLRSNQTVPPRHAQGDDEHEYGFLERVVLDETSFEAFRAEIANPSEPTAALRALFKK